MATNQRGAESPLLHERAGEMYCSRLWNAKEEKDVFTWWHCVYPSKADCRERRCRCTIWRWRMTEHLAAPGWHANLAARSRWWWRATIGFSATSFSRSLSAFTHSSANKAKIRGRTHFALPQMLYNHVWCYFHICTGSNTCINLNQLLHNKLTRSRTQLEMFLLLDTSHHKNARLFSHLDPYIIPWEINRNVKQSHPISQC